MHYATLLVAASTALLARAQSDRGAQLDYITEVCQPNNSTGYPDMTAPCNELPAVQFQCYFGPEEGLAVYYSLFGPDSNSTYGVGKKQRRQADLSNDDPLPQSNATQRVCVCESQFFDLLNGCIACEKKHGSGEEETFFTPEYVASMSRSYCAASSTPTVDLSDFLNNFIVDAPASISSSVEAASSSSFSDPIGNSTAVSLYYTQKVTGSPAWVIAEATNSVSSTASDASEAAATYTSVNVVSGQIVPTAAGGSGGAAASSSSSTGTHNGAAAPTARSEAVAAIAGVVGFAGLVALL